MVHFSDIFIINTVSKLIYLAKSLTLKAKKMYTVRLTLSIKNEF